MLLNIKLTTQLSITQLLVVTLLFIYIYIYILYVYSFTEAIYLMTDEPPYRYNVHCTTYNNVSGVPYIFLYITANN